MQFTGLEQCLVLLFRRVAFASLVRELFDFFPLLLEAGAVDFRIQLAQAPEFLAFLHPQEQFLVSRNMVRQVSASCVERSFLCLEEKNENNPICYFISIRSLT